MAVAAAGSRGQSSATPPANGAVSSSSAPPTSKREAERIISRAVEELDAAAITTGLTFFASKAQVNMEDWMELFTAFLPLWCMPFIVHLIKRRGHAHHHIASFSSPPVQLTRATRMSRSRFSSPVTKRRACCRALCWPNI